MTYTGTLTSEAEIALYSGAGVGAAATEANNNLLVAQAEAFVTSLSRYDWVTNYASLAAVYKQILSEYCARFAAVGLIANNMSGYTSRIEAEDMINICLARMFAIEKIISEQNFVTEVKA